MDKETATFVRRLTQIDADVKPAPPSIIGLIGAHRRNLRIIVPLPQRMKQPGPRSRATPDAIA
jgi:hypothetical protein